MKQKDLIVKLGYLETIDNRTTSNNVSLGDIFSSTAILHIFKNGNVTWLTTPEGEQLLMDNPYVQRLLLYDMTTMLQLKSERFDVIVNLEKIPGVCALTDSMQAWRRYGFRFDEKKGSAEAYEHSYEVLANSDDPGLRKKMKKHWIEMLYEMIGAKWDDEGYVLGYKPKTKEKFDIGFNINVSSRWPSKAWPREYWNELEGLIGAKYSVSYQKSLNDIHGYIDWLNSCRTIITNDSLGLHLSIALKKKIIALFGPTSEKEVHLFGLGEVIKPDNKLKCLPCFNPSCKYGKSCMYNIKPQKVYKKIKEIIKR